MNVPDWRLPPGVSRGAWDYAQSRSVAEGYDAYHGDHPLFAVERAVVDRAIGPPPPGGGVVADLGCGTGRALLPLVRRGWRGLAVDLSAGMLDVVQQKADADGLDVECLRANLVELGPDFVADASVDHALCLFSTLGMVRGRANRRTALGHVRRVLKPGGRLVLHAHNLWWNLRDPGGPWWVLRSVARAALAKPGGFELGDKTYPYRGVPNFFLHAYRSGELRADLRAANFATMEWVPLAAGAGAPLGRPWLLPSVRATGWLVVAEAQPTSDG